MFARTPRLLLRPGWMEDAPALTAAIGDEAIVRNLASAPWPYGEDDARAFLATWTDARLPRFLMVQRTAAEPRLIGGIGIDAGAAGDVELGYWIARPYWGLGYATEAGRHMVDLARTLGVRTIKAAHFLDNPASGAVLRKLGFRPTGRIAMRASKGRGGEAPTAEYIRSVEAPGNDGDSDGNDARGDVAFRWPEVMREDWRQAAA
jgi:RimJ/RimL family protein N-acetyltransferase